jgi:WXG100 family type VII secretion target
MPEKSGMNYQTMREMTKEFQNAEKQLRETMSAVKKQAKDIEGGALLGQAGQDFQAALTGPLNKALEKLATKMQELAGDIEGARAFYEDGETKSQSRFK